MAIVIHHPVKTVANGHTNWGPPAWVDHPIIQAYRVAAFDDPSIDVPTGGGALYNVKPAKLTQALSDGAILLADNLADKTLDKSGRDAIEAIWGVRTPADVDSPRDAIIRVLGVDANPDGILGPRPIMPGHKRMFQWKLGLGDARGVIDIVKPAKFDPRFNRDSSHFATRSHVLDVMMEGVGNACDQGDTETGSKVAGFNALKCGVKPSDFADFASAFIPARHKGLKPKIPTTKYTSDFTAANGTTVAGFTEENTGWSIVSNKAENDTPGGDVSGGLRYSSPLSGVDHEVFGDVTWENAGSSFIGPAVRWSNSAFTNYALVGSAVSTSEGLFRFTSAAATVTLLSVAHAFTAQTLSSWLWISGSLLHGFIGGYELAFVDTALTTELYTGFVARSLASGLNHKLDGFITQDLHSTAPQRGRGIFTGGAM